MKPDGLVGRRAASHRASAAWPDRPPGSEPPRRDPGPPDGHPTNRRGSSSIRLPQTSTILTALPAAPALALAQEEHGGSPNLLDPHYGLMVWTLLIFVVLLFVLSRYAFKPLTQAVAEREAALEAAIA